MYELSGCIDLLLKRLRSIQSSSVYILRQAPSFLPHDTCISVATSSICVATSLPVYRLTFVYFLLFQNNFLPLTIFGPPHTHSFFIGVRSTQEPKVILFILPPSEFFIPFSLHLPFFTLSKIVLAFILSFFRSLFHPSPPPPLIYCIKI